MRTIVVERIIVAERPEVWAVLADFGDIAAWNDGVRQSHLTGDIAQGVGARRHCDLAPIGGLEETVTEWLPNERMVVRIDETTKLPIKNGNVIFSLLHGGVGQTKVIVRYEFETKLGPIGRAAAPFIEGQLESGFEDFLTQLESAAIARRHQATTTNTEDASA